MELNKNRSSIKRRKVENWVKVKKNLEESRELDLSMKVLRMTGIRLKYYGRIRTQEEEGK